MQLQKYSGFVIVKWHVHIVKYWTKFRIIYAFFQLVSLVLPDHWMKHFFLGHTFLELQLNEDALNIYFSLQQHGFQKSTYLIAQTAIAFHNRRGSPIQLLITF